MQGLADGGGEGGQLGEQHDKTIASLWNDWKKLQEERKQQMVAGAPLQASSHALQDIENDPFVNSDERAQSAVMARIDDLENQESAVCNFGGGS